MPPGSHPHVLRRPPAPVRPLVGEHAGLCPHKPPWFRGLNLRTEEAVRVATDSVYIQKTALHKLEGVEAHMASNTCVCGGEWCVRCLTGQTYLPTVAPAHWRNKGRAAPYAYVTRGLPPQPEYKGQQKNLPLSPAPRYNDH